MRGAEEAALDAESARQELNSLQAHRHTVEQQMADQIRSREVEGVSAWRPTAALLHLTPLVAGTYRLTGHPEV